MPSCDVIIPVYNSSAGLRHSLPALVSQSVPSGWSIRIIISDDGSLEDTEKIVREILSSPPALFSWEFVSGPHVGPAGARNRALDLTQGDILFFLGADIVLTPGSLAAHLNFHANFTGHNLAAVGMVKWDPRLRPTPFMEWLVHGGPQNDFDSILGLHCVDPRHYFYGSNLSLKQQALNGFRFLEKFRGYGWEDLEIGTRLAQHGLRLRVLSDAVGLHYHFNSLSDTVKRQELVGYNLYVWQSLMPKLKLISPSGTRKSIKRRLFWYSGAHLVLLNLLQATHRHFSTPRLFQILTTSALWRGIEKAKTSQNI